MYSSSAYISSELIANQRERERERARERDGVQLMRHALRSPFSVSAVCVGHPTYYGKKQG